MERLIKDANKYRKEQGKNADLSIDSYADIIEAIQTVQEQQGIAGTTAKESMTTIQGSADATKAAWQNVLTAIAGGGDLKQAMSGLVSSLFGSGDGGGLINQVIPRIKAIFEGVADFIGQAAPLIAAKLPELVTSILPSLLSAAGSLIKALATALPGLLKAIWDTIKAVAPTLLATIGSLVSQIPSALGGLVSQIPSALGGILSAIGGWIASNAASFAEKGGEILTNIKDGIVNAVGNIVEGFSNLVSTITGWVSSHSGDLLAVGQNILSWIVTGIKAFISNVLNGFVSFISTVTGWVGSNSQALTDVGTSILDWIVSGIADFISKVKDGFSGMVAQISDKVTSVSASLINIGLNILLKIKNGIANNISKIKDGLSGMVGAIREKITSMAASLKNIGSFIVTKIVSGLSDLGTKIKEKVQSILTSLAEHTFIFKPKVNTDTGKITNGAYSGHNSEFAKAKNAPYLFTKGTVFGRYNGENLIAGEAGPEMLLGVNKLNAMLFQSVQGGMQSMMGQISEMVSGAHSGGNSLLEAQILDVLQRYLPNIADRQVVLDTGVLAEAVAPGVNAVLGNSVSNRRRYNA